MPDQSPVAHTPAKGSNQWHDLKEHLQDVAGRAKEYAAKFGAGDLGHYAGLWHDLGKYNPDFQRYLQQCASAQDSDVSPRSVPHAIYGAKLAWEVLKPIAPVIYGHHSGLPQIQEMKTVKLTAPEHETVYQTVIDQAQQHGIVLKPEKDLNHLFSQLYEGNYSYEMMTRLLFSCLVDADYLDTEEHFAPDAASQRGSKITVSQLWETLQEKQKHLLNHDTVVNQVRAEVYEACLEAARLPTGVFRLAVPTGGGKTRSGLAFALSHASFHNLNRVIVAVPYTSIIEQTAKVYRDIFGDEAVLEHHSAAFSEAIGERKKEQQDEGAQRLMAQARLATQNWDAPLIVTTTVQLFESLFHNRPSKCRKLHNIIGSVIILDEVQTIPVGLLKPILNVLQELVHRYRVTVVLCTATQPALEGKSPYLEGFDSVQDIVPPETAKAHFSSLCRVNYDIFNQVWTWEQVVEDVQNHQHDQALIVLNTRKNALNLLDAFLSGELNDDSHILHLSTLLCGAHRRQVLAKVRDRLQTKQPCILVSTQVVEAGVDLDFPAVYRALGPLDRIVQAAGRCNREGKLPEQGRVVVFQPQKGTIPPGEYKTAVDETARLLRRPNLDLHDPKIFQIYFRSLYQGLEKDKYKVQDYRASLDYPEVAKRFKLIADDTTPVVIQYDDRAHNLIQQIQRRGLYANDHRALQPYLVNLRNREFQQAQEVRREIAPEIWLWEGSYDPVKGIGLGDQAISYDPFDLIH